MPSAGSTALSSTVPETFEPDGVRTQLTGSGLNESEPVPHTFKNTCLRYSAHTGTKQTAVKLTE